MSDNKDTQFEELLQFIRDARGFDFTGYKRSTLTRRINKRMHEFQVSTYPEYQDALESDPHEFTNLFNTILINVTSFFRDADSWRYLHREILPNLLAEIDPNEEIRVWSAGCSSGEEAYTLAIIFAETLGAVEAANRVKIYATDVDEDALQTARTSMYPASALSPLSTEVREKYFEKSGTSYVFRSDLRRRVIFGRHDISRDAPISRLHLLVCRNTLMYFNAEAQSQIVDRFHYALRDQGYLFLGKAEMLLADSERFELINMRQRLFRRRPGASQPPHQPARMAIDFPVAQSSGTTSRDRLVRDLVNDASPNAVICVNPRGELVLVNAKARTEFGLTEQDAGKQIHELEISYRPIELRSLIDRAHSGSETVTVSNVERNFDDQSQFFDVIVQPIMAKSPTIEAISITFIDTTEKVQLQSELKQNREDLETAYEELQSTNEELETTNEELQSSIEELETTNEELQSTNEELETTNEELQSGNEELETMNEEMRIRTSELEETRYFLEGVLSSVAAAVVVLDSALRVRSWNRGSEDLWGLREDEVHQQSFLRLDFGMPTAELTETLQRCLESGQRIGPISINAVNRKGRSFVCSVICSPLQGEGQGEGLVLLMEETQPRENANTSA
jgi:two-component system CheB/CheR fusion protein